MKVNLLVLGKTTEKYLEEGILIYSNRLKHYLPFSIEVIPELKQTKNLTFQQQKEKEAELIMKNLQSNDYLILLDDKGKEFTSIQFSKFMEKSMAGISGRIVFLIGGPYGFDESIYQRSNFKISLSKLTFSHQMVRLFFLEQLYRAMTILKNEPYHHE